MGPEDFQSIDFPDPDAMEDWADNNPHLTPRERRLVKAEAKSWRDENGQEYVEHLNKRSEVIANEVTALAEAAVAELRIVAQAPQDLRTQKITVKDALKILAEGKRQHDSFVKRRDSIAEYVERWNEDADADPVEKLHRDQERFRTGNPRHGRRALTAKMLRGES
jgi:hypothetical protein